MADFEMTIEISSEDKRSLKFRLMEIASELDTKYGKPCQGVVITGDTTTKVTTPRWNGENY